MALSPSCDMLMLDEDNEPGLNEEIISAQESGDEDDGSGDLDGDGDGWGHDTHLLTTFNNISLRSIVFHKDDPDHDFSLMAMNPKYAGTLILYAENYMCWRNPSLQPIGGGSAVIRPMAAGTVQTAGALVAGVVTGYSSTTGGFEVLGKDEKLIIDLCFYKIFHMLKTNPNIHNVVFACDPSNKHKFGQSIFMVCKPVIDFISGKLIEIVARLHDPDYKVPPRHIIERTCKIHLDKTASLLHSHYIWNTHLEDLLKLPLPSQTRNHLDSILLAGKKRKERFDVPVPDWKLPKAAPKK